MKMSLTVLTVSRVQTENDHLSPMEEWNVTNYKKQKGENFTQGQELHCTCMNGKPGTLLKLNWAFVLTNFVWISDICLQKVVTAT